MKIVLIRHGKTKANENSSYCGSTDLPLSEIGKSEIISMRSSGCYPDISQYRVFTSGMKRTEETLACLYGDIQHETLPDMKEMDFGSFEMRNYSELRHDPEYVSWCSGDNQNKCTPGGESGRDMRDRVIACISQLRNDGQDVLIVTHGGPIAAVMDHYFPEEDKNRFQWQPEAGSGYILFFENSRCFWKSIPERSDHHG